MYRRLILMGFSVAMCASGTAMAGFSGDLSISAIEAAVKGRQAQTAAIATEAKKVGVSASTLTMALLNAGHDSNKVIGTMVSSGYDASKVVGTAVALGVSQKTAVEAATLAGADRRQVAEASKANDFGRSSEKEQAGSGSSKIDQGKGTAYGSDPWKYSPPKFDPKSWGDYRGNPYISKYYSWWLAFLEAYKKCHGPFSPFPTHGGGGHCGVSRS
ncbi:MAG: hypothetical protein WBP72_12115 [Rhodocyclaceae bacterium]